ncbi:MAG: 16S rRNA (guanine(966)-N(2))-methyltransferase RsmD [Gammaproteobacteria bacterium]|nr:16S rRNA (guanine(966)-N(2))-methyltransferase RsmD [Gammaproteobacteria bacterium]
MSKQLKSNTIRIIAGKWRGRRIPVINSPGLRPTTDRVRETIFNWLMHEITAANCLDLFAGSGALGFESLSRGAASVHFVESDRHTVMALQDCIDMLRVNSTSEKAVLHQASALELLQRAPACQFDIAFLDPPFQSNLMDQAASLLEQNGWLSADAWIVIECDSKRPEANLPSQWQLFKQARAGMSAYYLYRRMSG